ncbi:MAG: hypothetical protein ACRDQU_05955 [Pseudonocardiaceae bacterium]
MAVMHYQTRDGLADYGFSIEFRPDSGWGVYIVFQPFYYGHDDGLKFPYQSIDCKGRRYVNWPAEIDSLGDAKTVAALWAELVQRYLRAEEKRTADSEKSEGLESCKQLRKDVA